MLLDPGKMNKRVRFERPTLAGDSRFGGGERIWTEVCTVWAEVLDILPSRSESAPQGVEIDARPARVRIRARPGLSPDMRLVVMGTVPRVMHIAAGPASIDRGAGLEFMAQEISTNG
ncbi:MAG: head-tail adaptor protein [Xylophilus ampelinus]